MRSSKPPNSHLQSQPQIPSSPSLTRTIRIPQQRQQQQHHQQHQNNLHLQQPSPTPSNSTNRSGSASGSGASTPTKLAPPTAGTTLGLRNSTMSTNSASAAAAAATRSLMPPPPLPSKSGSVRAGTMALPRSRTASTTSATANSTSGTGLSRSGTVRGAPGSPTKMMRSSTVRRSVDGSSAATNGPSAGTGLARTGTVRGARPISMSGASAAEGTVKARPTSMTSGGAEGTGTVRARPMSMVGGTGEGAGTVKSRPTSMIAGGGTVRARPQSIIGAPGAIEKDGGAGLLRKPSTRGAPPTTAAAHRRAASVSTQLAPTTSSGAPPSKQRPAFTTLKDVPGPSARNHPPPQTQHPHAQPVSAAHLNLLNLHLLYTSGLPALHSYTNSAHSKLRARYTALQKSYPRAPPNPPSLQPTEIHKLSTALEQGFRAAAAAADLANRFWDWIDMPDEKGLGSHWRGDVERVVRGARGCLEGLEEILPSSSESSGDVAEEGGNKIEVVEILRGVLQGVVEECEGWVVVERLVCRRERERLEGLVEEVGAVPEEGGVWRRVKV